MHELGIMTGVMESARKAAQDAGAVKVLKVRLRIGEMTEAIEDALVFAWEALTEADPYFEGAELEVDMVRPKSKCLECGAVFEHDRFHMFCPECDSFLLELIAGREKQIDSIEVDLPEKDDGEDAAGKPPEAEALAKDTASSGLPENGDE